MNKWSWVFSHYYVSSRSIWITQIIKTSGRVTLVMRTCYYQHIGCQCSPTCADCIIYTCGNGLQITCGGNLRVWTFTAGCCFHHSILHVKSCSECYTSKWFHVTHLPGCDDADGANLTCLMIFSVNELYGILCVFRGDMQSFLYFKFPVITPRCTFWTSCSRFGLAFSVMMDSTTRGWFLVDFLEHDWGDLSVQPPQHQWGQARMLGLGGLCSVQPKGVQWG